MLLKVKQTRCYDNIVTSDIYKIMLVKKKILLSLRMECHRQKLNSESNQVTDSRCLRLGKN